MQSSTRMAGEKLCCPLASTSNPPLQHLNLDDDDHIVKKKLEHISYLQHHHPLSIICFISLHRLSFIRLVLLETWWFPTRLIGGWEKVTCDDGTDIWWKDNDEGGKLQERTVNLDKRCGINVTVVTNTNCAAETNTSVHSSEFFQIPLFLNGTHKLFTSCLYLLNRSQNRYKISNKMPQTHKINQ